MLGCPRCRATYPDDMSECPADGVPLLPVEALPPAEQPLLPGTMVGEYRIEKKLGSGTFGEVYAGEHPLIGKRVAIKVLHRKYSSDAEVVSRFVSEARAVNRIRHRNIIDIFSFGLLGESRHYFVMELVQGLTLAELLEREKVLPIERALPIFAGIASGLDAAHEAGITHRDLKPENIFLAAEKDGTYFPKLLDFGIAKLQTEDVAHKTATGVAMGTPRYMSPEQCRGRAVDHRADIYALGVLVHEVLTGHPPFDADTTMDLLFKHSLTPPPAMSSVNPALAPELDRPVLAMLAKRPKDRPASAGEAVASLLQAATAAGHVIASPQSSQTTARSAVPAATPRAVDPLVEPPRVPTDAATVAIRARAAPRTPNVATAPLPETEPPTIVDPRRKSDRGRSGDDVISGDAATVSIESVRSATEIIPTSPGGTHLNEESIPEGVISTAPPDVTVRSPGNAPKAEPGGGARLQGGASNLQLAPAAPAASPADTAPKPPPPPPPRPAPLASRAPLLLGATGAILAIVFVVRAVTTGSGPLTPAASGSAPPAQTSAAAASGSVVARVAVTPADAVAIVGDRRISLAREPLTLPRGTDSVLVRFERDGYDPVARWFDPRTADTDLATVTLAPAATVQPVVTAPSSAAPSAPGLKPHTKPKDTADPAWIERPPEIKNPR